jgi:hypothetical protein
MMDYDQELYERSGKVADCPYCDNRATVLADYKDYEETGAFDEFGNRELREVMIPARYCVDCGVTFDIKEA